MAKPEAWSRWQQLARSKFLIGDAQGASRAQQPQYKCGVSVAYLKSFAKTLGTLMDEIGLRDSTTLIMQRIIVPFVSKAGSGRLWNHIPLQHTGPPMYCVTHAWSGSFLEMVAALAEELAPAHGCQTVDEDIYVWLDVFALDHTSTTPSVVIEAGIAVEEAQAACSKGVVLALDHSKVALSRTRCLYEAFMALRLKGKTAFRVAIPADSSITEIESLFETFLALDICKTDSSQAQDKIDVLSKVRASRGLQRTNKDLSDGMTHSLLCRLRWSGRPEDCATLAVILLKNNRLFELQAHLSSMFKVSDKVLIETVFKTYDTDNSGDIDENEFVNGMSALGGFSITDCVCIFQSIDVDKNGVIDMDEFMDWWDSEEGARVSQLMKKEHREDFGVLGLRSNLDTMEEWLGERKQLKGHLAVFRALVRDVDLPTGGVNIVRAKLPPPALAGNITQALNSVAEFTKTKDNKSSCTAVFALLMQNTELLSFHPDTLQHPGSCSDDVQDQAHLLALYLASLARLLRFQGTPFALEADYCTCMTVMILEGWKGLPPFGGHMHFWKGAMEILQAKAASRIGATITHERLDLAQHLAKLCDDKKRPPQSEADDGGQAGSASKLLLNSPLPSLSEFRLNLVRAGLDYAVADATRLVGRQSSIRAAAATSSSTNRRLSSGSKLSDQGSDASRAPSRRVTEQDSGAFAGMGGRSMNRRLTEQDGAGGGGLLGGSGAMRSRRATEQDAGAFSGMGGGAMRSRRGTEQDGAFAGLGGGPGGRSGSRRGTEQDGGFEDFDAMCNQAAEAKQQQQQQAGFSSFIDRSQGSRTLQRMLSGIGEDSRGSTPSAVSNAAASMRNHAAIRRNSTLEGVELPQQLAELSARLANGVNANVYRSYEPAPPPGPAPPGVPSSRRNSSMESGGGMAPMRSTYSGTGHTLAGGLQRAPSIADEMAGLSVARSPNSMRMTRPGASLLDGGGPSGGSSFVSGGSSFVSEASGSFTGPRTLGPAPVVSSSSRRKSCLDPSMGASAMPGSPVSTRRKSSLEPGVEMRSTYSGTEHAYRGDVLHRVLGEMGGGGTHSQVGPSKPSPSLLDSGEDLGVARSQGNMRMNRPSFDGRFPSIVKR